METLECDQCSIVRMNTMLQNALIVFINSVRECCSLKGIIVNENKIDTNKSSFVINVIKIGQELDDILFESCKTIFELFKELTNIDVSINVLDESQLTGLQLESLDYNDSDNIIYESKITQEDKKNTGIQYVKKI